MGKAKWRQYSPEQIAEFVKESISWAELAEKIGYSKNSGSSTAMMQAMCTELNLDTSHFLGQAHNRNQFDYNRFQYGKAIKTKHMKAALIALKGEQCEKCGNTTWLNETIPLEVHHIDGDHLNSELSNLQLLCPNCHALTENWRGKNITAKEKMQISDEALVEALRTHRSVRQALLSVGLTGAGGNYTRAYELIHQYNIEHLIK